MTTIKEKLSRGINPPNMLQSMASGYRREALAEIERLEKGIDELRAENKRLALIVADYEMADYKGQVEGLTSELGALRKDYATYRWGSQEIGLKTLRLLSASKAESASLRAKLAALDKRYPKSFAEAHPRNPNAKCKCEHWQSCHDCHPTAHAEKYNPAPVYTSNCLHHPAAPHGVDVDASWRAGKTVCVCQSWAPGEAS